MLELLRESLLVYNFFFTGLLILTLLYWLLLIVGMVDVDLFSPEIDVDLDVDIDADVDLDVDVDADADVDVDADSPHAKAGIGAQVLRFFNIGEVPFMVVFSIIIFITWPLSILANYYFNSGGSVTLGFLFAGIAFCTSLIPAKYASFPFKIIFRRLESSTKHESLEGEAGVVRTAVIDSSYGQVEIVRDGSHVVLNAFPFYDDEPLSKGDRVLIINHDEERNKYGVTKIKPEDNL
ncbi:MAG: hypothetical protein ACPGN3_08260 [Opitutales bacterium]